MTAVSHRKDLDLMCSIKKQLPELILYVGYGTESCQFYLSLANLAYPEDTIYKCSKCFYKSTDETTVIYIIEISSNNE